MAKKGHSEACRRRIEDMMREDADDKKKLEASDERITHQIARRLEQEDRKRKPEPEVPTEPDQMREGEEKADADAEADCLQNKRVRTTLVESTVAVADEETGVRKMRTWTRRRR